MLQEAASQLTALQPSPYREALNGLVTTLDGMIAQFGSQSA
jgi:hypothetical protein